MSTNSDTFLLPLNLEGLHRYPPSQTAIGWKWCSITLPLSLGTLALGAFSCQLRSPVTLREHVEIQRERCRRSPNCFSDQLFEFFQLTHQTYEWRRLWDWLKPQLLSDYSCIRPRARTASLSPVIPRFMGKIQKLLWVF